MTQGIYILANDRVLDQAIALLNSIRLHDLQTPVVMIPYDASYHQAAAVLGDRFGVQLYGDLEFLESLDGKIIEIFGDRFFARPNQFRKQAAWFGAFEEFLYIDTDIIVFEPIIQTLKYLKSYDFICYDYQHRGGISNVFSPLIKTESVFTDTELEEIFNCGFWGAKAGLFSLSELYETFQECAAQPRYFDFSQKTSDQPIINYLVLKRIGDRFNIVHRPGGAAGSWAGSRFQQRGHQLFDSTMNQPVSYLHWAGFRIQPGCPYWSLWQHYRNLE